jgi:phosphoribosyl 1,2-cyclic phosphate phosphodiesterase
MTVEGARSMGDQLNADETRIVHTSHFIAADRAFEDPLAVDGERYEL